MVVGRDAVLVPDVGKKKAKNVKWKEMEEKHQHEQEGKEILDWLNNAGGQDALENE